MKFKRILGLVLAVLMIMSTFSVGIFAEEQTPEETTSIDTSNRTLPEGAVSKAEGWVLANVEGELKDTQVKWEIYTLGDETVLNFTLWPEETEKVETTSINVVDPETGSGISYTTFGKQQWAGEYKTTVTKVVIGDGITYISNGAFGGMNKIKVAEIPASLTSIGGYAFENCGSLSTVYIAGNEPVAGQLDLSNISDIRGYCFDGACPVTSVKLNVNYAKEIPVEAFKSTAIQEIELPAGVTKVVDKAFSNVSKLVKVIVNGAETAIERYAFANGLDSTKADFVDYIGQITIVAPKGSAAEQFCKDNASTGIKFESLGGDDDESEVVIPEMPEMPEDALTGNFSASGKNDLKWTFDATKGLLVIHGEDTVLEMDYSLSWNGKHEKDTDGDGTKEVLAVLPWVGGSIKSSDIKEVIVAAPITTVGAYMLSYLGAATKMTIPTTLTDLSASGALSYSDSLTTVVVAGNEAVEGVIDLSNVTKIGAYALDDAFKGQTVKILTGDIEYFVVTKFLQYCAAVEIMLKPGTPLDAWATKYKNGEISFTIVNSQGQEEKVIGSDIKFTYYGEEGGNENEDPDQPDVPVEPDNNIVNGNVTSQYNGSDIVNNLWTLDRTTGVLTITSNKSGYNETGAGNSKGGWGAYMTEITEVVCIGNMTKITGSAFVGAVNLKKVTASNPTQIDNSAFFGCTSLETVCVSGHVAIPGVLDFSTVSGNGKGGSCFTAQIFNGETKATGIILGSVYKDEDGFRLNKNNLPTNITTIYGATEYLATFAEENGLKFVPFGKTADNKAAWMIKDGVLTVMGEGAIANINVPEAYAADVKSVIIPDSVTSLGDGAFAALTALEMAQFKGNAPEVAEGAKPFGEQSDSFKVVASAYAEGFEGETWCGYALELKTYYAGDVNGDSSVDVRDAVLLAQFLAHWTVVIDENAADCDGDGEISVADAILLAQYLAHWNVELVGPTAPNTPDNPGENPGEDPDAGKYGDNEVEAGDAV